jgi:branched-chain amino acid transport system ATP-binding protein/branched-chain amino acid transport system permease protein
MTLRRLTNVGALIALLAVPYGVSTYGIHIANLVLIFVMLAVGLSIVLGYAGQVNLAQAAFFGMGAYASAVLTVKVGLGYWAAFPLSILSTGLLGLLVGLPSLRVQSHYLGIVTLGLALAFSAVLVNASFTGQAIGLPGLPIPTFPGVDLGDEYNYYYVLLAAAGVLFGLASLMMRTELGRRFQAMRDDSLAAAHVGVEVPMYRMVAFLIAACFAGVAGALYAGLIHYVSPDTFNLGIMFLLLAMVIVGGRDNLYGAALGAAVLLIVRQQFDNLQQYQQVAYGLLIVGMVVAAPEGLAGLTRRFWTRLKQAHPGGRVDPAEADTTLDEAELSGLGVDEGLSAGSATLAIGSNGRATRRLSGDASALEVDGVGKSFKGLKALVDVSLSVQAGSIHGIVGPNGSGKTTLFNVVTGVYGPTSGEIRAFGERVSGRAAYRVCRAGVARTFQALRLFGSLTVRENIMVALDRARPTAMWRYALAPWTFRARERELRRRADELLERFTLSRVADFRATNLPYGQQRLVEIARAMATDPRLLLLDEPAAGLSSVEMNDLRQLVTRIRDGGITVVLIEHNMGLVMSLCDRVTVLANGQVLAEGAPADVTRDRDVIETYLGDANLLEPEGSPA